MLGEILSETELITGASRAAEQTMEDNHISDQTIKDSDIVDHHHVTFTSASINLTFNHKSCTIQEDTTSTNTTSSVC